MCLMVSLIFAIFFSCTHHSQYPVGMSRVHSHDRNPLSRPRSVAENPHGGYLGQPPNQQLGGPHDSIQAHDHLPFTEQELALALKRSHLTVPVQA